LVYAINPKANDSIYDLDINVYFGEGYLMEEMDGLKFKIGQNHSFRPTTNKLWNYTEKHLNLQI
jgi:23S rRNA (uracil1939-C5)-methyltransferase